MSAFLYFRRSGIQNLGGYMSIEASAAKAELILQILCRG